MFHFAAHGSPKVYTGKGQSETSQLIQLTVRALLLKAYPLQDVAFGLLQNYTASSLVDKVHLEELVRLAIQGIPMVINQVWPFLPQVFSAG